MNIRAFMPILVISFCLATLNASFCGQRESSRKMTRQEIEKRVKREVEENFNRRDSNGDGILDDSELSSRYRERYKRYDRNNSGKISRTEYAAYIRAYLEKRYGANSNGGSSSTSPRETDVDLSNLDKRPPVARAGNLPLGLPDWFEELDDRENGGDGDGQVGLYEWRAARKDLAYFDQYDRNDDGFLTVKEMLYFDENVTKADFAALGNSLSHWQLDAKQAQSWKSASDVFYYNGKGGGNLRTKKHYGDFEMWVDWKIKRGGDSGIYLRGKPQVQIWDRSEGSGGLYSNRRGSPGREPLVVADNPPGKWNRFHIRMVGDRVTVRLNGKLVVDDQQMLNGDVPETGPIELQARNDVLWFRNFFVKELSSSR